jgi:ribosomal protein S16
LQSPPVLSLKRERIQHWLDHGATPSQTAEKLIAAVDAGSSLKQRRKPSAVRRANEKVASRQAKAATEAEGGPPPLNLHILMQESTSLKIKNMIDGLLRGLIDPVEIIVQK